MENLIFKIIAPIVSAFLGAMSAFWYQRVLDKRREKRAVIQTLMMYRNVGAKELDWINALNVVDIVFSDNKKVTDLYHDFIAQCDPSLYSNGQWIETFYSLVEEMAKRSGYNGLSKQQIREFYQPEALRFHYRHLVAEQNPLPPTPESLGVYKDGNQPSASSDSQHNPNDKNQSDEKN